MQKERKKHYRHDEIVHLIKQGGSNRSIGRQLHCDKNVVARVRNDLGYESVVRTMTPEQKVLRGLVSDGDHVGWKGNRSNSGVPSIKVFDRLVPASHVVFRQRTGRDPVGIVKSECGYPNCLNPIHLSDNTERRSLRLLERSLHGMEAPWKKCPAGIHSWDQSGRVEPAPSLKIYCLDCNTERCRRNRNSRREEREVA